MNPLLWYVLWLIVAVTLLAVVAAMFVHDIGRFSRREPLRIPFIGEAHPGDVAYPLAVIELFGPYLTLCAAATFLTGLTTYLAIFSGP